MKRHLFPALGLVLAAAACGRGGGGSPAEVSLDVRGWRLEHAASVGGPDADEQEMLFTAGEVAEDPEGRFYVINFGDRRIQVFDSAGTFIRNVGRKGKGPGEFTSPMSVAAVGSDGLWLLETVPARIMKFRRSTGEFVDNVPIESKQLIPSRMTVGGDGRVAMEFKTMLQATSHVVSRSFVAWVDTARGSLQRVVEFDSTTLLRNNQRGPTGTRSVVGNPPFAPRPVWAPDGRGGVLFGDGSEFALYRAAAGAAPALAFRGRGEAARVTDADREQFLSSRSGKLFKNYDFPERKPFIGEVVVDASGLVWLNRPGESGAQTWEVRRATGEKLGELRVPAGSRVLSVSRHSVYVVSRDELDVETLHRYRLIRG
jgi:hypothetical protein